MWHRIFLHNSLRISFLSFALSSFLSLHCHAFCWIVNVSFHHYVHVAMCPLKFFSHFAWKNNYHDWICTHSKSSLWIIQMRRTEGPSVRSGRESRWGGDHCAGVKRGWRVESVGGVHSVLWSCSQHQLYVWVGVCGWEGWREGERGREGGRERVNESKVVKQNSFHTPLIAFTKHSTK